MSGMVVLVVVLSLLTGAVLGIVVYNNYYGLSESIMEKYDLAFMLLPSIAMFVVGYFLGGRGKGAQSDFAYRPMFQGNVQPLGREGDRIVMVALRRAGIVREKR